MLPIKTSGSHTEPGLPVDPNGHEDSEEVVAEWPDGSSHNLTGFTYADFKKLLGKRAGGDMGSYFTIQQKGTGHKVHIAQRVDRKLLMVVFEQGKHVLGLKLNLFAEISDESQRLPKEHHAVQEALKLLNPIAADFANLKLQKFDLMQARDKEGTGSTWHHHRQEGQGLRPGQGLQGPPRHPGQGLRPGGRLRRYRHGQGQIRAGGPEGGEGQFQARLHEAEGEG